MFGRKFREYVERSFDSINAKINYILDQIDSIIKSIKYRDSNDITYRVTLYTAYLESAIDYVDHLEDKLLLHTLDRINDHIIETSAFISVYEVPVELVNLFEEACHKFRPVFQKRYEIDPPCYKIWMKRIEKYRNENQTL